jgi:hypothetical protein
MLELTYTKDAIEQLRCQGFSSRRLFLKSFAKIGKGFTGPAGMIEGHDGFASTMKSGTHYLLDLWLCSWLKCPGEDPSGGIHHLQHQEVKTKDPRQYLQSLRAQ